MRSYSWRSRKGSLSMGIEAIVILVLAMAVLGLGLGFLRSVIGEGQKSVIKAINNADLENPATSENPITVDSGVVVKKGGSAIIKVGVFAKDNDIVSDVNFICADPLATAGAKSVSQTVTANSASAYQVTIKIDNGVPEGSYPCTVSVGTLSKQTVVTITS